VRHLNMTNGGLALVVVGWLVRVGLDPLVAAWLPVPVTRVAGGAQLGFELVWSGFALCFLAVLRHGLQAFTQTQATIAEQIDRQLELRRREAQALEDAVVPGAQSVSSIQAVASGQVEGRPFIRFADGSVAMDTALGPRRFATIGEARSFVG
jgi:hypothetical protein